jgi:hypothetical protein
MLVLSSCSLCPTLVLLFTAAHCYCSLLQLLSKAASVRGAALQSCYCTHSCCSLQLLTVTAQLLLPAAAHRCCLAAAPGSCSPLLFSAAAALLCCYTAAAHSAAAPRPSPAQLLILPIAPGALSCRSESSNISLVVFWRILDPDSN